MQKLLKDKLFFLSKTNREFLGIFALFVKDPVQFIKTHYLAWKDSFIFVFEKNPAFHASPTCPRLYSIFENFYIPEKIKVNNLIPDLRAFANSNEALFRSDKKEFVMKCITHFNSIKPDLSLTHLDFIEVEKPNSGVAVYNNASISEIIEAIKKLSADIDDFFKRDDNATVARNLIDKLFLKDKPDIPRPLGLPTEIVRKALMDLDDFNKLFIRLATEYYLALFNPKNEFDSTILDALNFKPCGSCYGANWRNDQFGDPSHDLAISPTPDYIRPATENDDIREMEKLLFFEL